MKIFQYEDNFYRTINVNVQAIISWLADGNNLVIKFGEQTKIIEYDKDYKAQSASDYFTYLMLCPNTPEIVHAEHLHYSIICDDKGFEKFLTGVGYE